MDKQPGTNPSQSNPRSVSCPFLGMQSDPQTHVGVADERNCCHLLKPPPSVAGAYQQGYCLSENFRECVVYANSGEGSIPAELFAEPIGRRGAAARRSSERPSRPVLIEQEPELAAEAAILLSGDDEDLTSQLHEQALNHYEQLGASKRGRNWWMVLLVLAILVLIGMTYMTIQRWQNAQAAQESALATARQNSLSTAVQNLATVSDTYATAAAIVKNEELTQTAQLVLTAAAEARTTQQAFEEATAQVLSVAQTATAGIASCQDLSSTSFEIVSGPTLLPEAGTIIGSGSPPLEEATATWMVKNNTNCGWDQLFLWSTGNNQILQPLMKKDGVEIKFATEPGKPMVSPGEVIELVIVVEPENAKFIKGDWVMVINGLSLFAQPHLAVDEDNWVKITLVTPTPTRGFRTPRPPSGSPTNTAPPNRPTDTPLPGRP